MKVDTILRNFSILAAAALFAGCAKDDPAAGNPGRMPVRFSAEVPTVRPSGHPLAAHDTRTVEGSDGQSHWTDGDRVGIFMRAAAGSNPGSDFPKADNIAYAVDPATGTLQAQDKTIYYPHDAAVDFIAYSPYTTISGTNIIDLNIVDQTTPERQAALDLLYSDNARGILGSEEPVALRFRHVLAKLRFDITLGDELAGGSVTHLSLSRQPGVLRLNMNSGSVSSVGPETTIEALKLAQSAAETDATFTALVGPVLPVSGRTLTVTVDGIDYTGEIPDADQYAGNTLYVYPVTVRAEGVEMAAMQIGGWQVTDQGPGNATVVASEIEKVRIPAGTFLMGSPTTEPGRRDHESESQREEQVQEFHMTRYEITNAQYAEFLNAKVIGPNGKYGQGLYPDEILIVNGGEGLSYQGNRWVPSPGYEEHPVAWVSWYGAAEYARWIGGSLPTEVQWEYACRGGQTESLPFGVGTGRKLTGELANFRANYPYDMDRNPPGAYEDPDWEYTESTTPVGSYPPNGYGLFDMHGNVAEWCADGFTHPETGDLRKCRGGSYWSEAQYCRSAYLVYNKVGTKSDTIGFRVVFN